MGMLDGKVAIVTGAGHGIGRGHAMELAKHGAKVVINDVGGSVSGEGAGRDADLTVDIIKSRGGEAVSNYADVSDYDAVGEMVAQAVDTFGGLDILVNNAGIVRDASIFKPASDARRHAGTSEASAAASPGSVQARACVAYWAERTEPLLLLTLLAAVGGMLNISAEEAPITAARMTKMRAILTARRRSALARLLELD